MHNDLMVDVARVLAALLEDRAWFRHGLTDDRLCVLTGLSRARVIVARRQALGMGFVERSGIGADSQSVTRLTPLGVARAQSEQPVLE